MLNEQTAAQAIELLKQGYRTTEVSRITGIARRDILKLVNGKHRFNRTPIPIRWKYELGNKQGYSRYNKKQLDISQVAMHKLADELLLATMQGKRYHPIVTKVHIQIPKDWGKVFLIQSGGVRGPTRGLVCRWFKISRIFEWLFTQIELPYTMEQFDMLESQVRKLDSMFGLLPPPNKDDLFEKKEDMLRYDLQLDFI